MIGVVWSWATSAWEAMVAKVRPAEGSTKAMWTYLPAILYCLSWCFVSSFLILLNNYLLHNGFPYPIILSSLGQLMSFVLTLILVASGALTLSADVDIRLWATSCLPVGMASAATLALGNIAYIYLSVSFIQMLKAGTPVVTMLVLFAAGMDKPRRDLVLSVTMITLGCGLAAKGELAFSWIGFILMLLSETAEALKIVAQQYLLTNHRLRFELHETLLYIAPAAFFWMMFYAAFTEFPAAATSSNITAETLMHLAPLLLLSAFMGFFVNFLTLGAVRSTSSLTFKVLGQGKNVAVVLGGIFFFRNVVTELQWLAYSIAIGGFYLYQRAVIKSPQRSAGGDSKPLQDGPSENGRSK